jgi:hypothetical protein
MARPSVDYQHRVYTALCSPEPVQGLLAGVIDKEEGVADEAVGTGGIGAGGAPDCRQA